MEVLCFRYSFPLKVRVVTKRERDDAVRTLIELRNSLDEGGIYWVDLSTEEKTDRIWGVLEKAPDGIIEVLLHMMEDEAEDIKRLSTDLPEMLVGFFMPILPSTSRRSSG